MKKKNEGGGISLPVFKSYYRATQLKTVLPAEEEAQRSMEQKGEPRNTHTNTVSRSWAKQQRQSWEKQRSSQQAELAQQDSVKEPSHRPCTFHKN